MKKDFTSIDNKLLKSINDLKTLISDQETVMQAIDQKLIKNIKDIGDLLNKCASSEQV